MFSINDCLVLLNAEAEQSDEQLYHEISQVSINVY